MYYDFCAVLAPLNILKFFRFLLKSVGVCGIIVSSERKAVEKIKRKITEKTIIFNWRILIFLLVFVALICFSVYFFGSGEKGLGFTLIFIALFISLGLFLTPLYFVFAKNEITVFWLIPYKRVITWQSVKRIIEFKWGEVYKDLPKYELVYQISYKGTTVVKIFDIPKNRRTKKAIEKHAKYKII